MKLFAFDLKRPLNIIWGILFLFGLYLTTLYHFLLFHSISELFSIVIAFGIFVVAWNARGLIENNYILFLGIAYLFVGTLDLIHTLAYKGMGVFHGQGTNLATQLWIAARYMESLSLLIAPLFLKRKFNTTRIFWVYTITTTILLISIFYLDVFPICFIEGIGLTPFKKLSEYLISFILILSFLILYKNKTEFDHKVFQLISWSIFLTIASEIFFTFYIHAYGLSNLIGHYFKILSFYFIYKAIIETGISKPFHFLFRDLKISEERLKKEKEKVQKYVDIAGTMIIVINPDETVALINQKGRKLLGYEEKEILGKKWFDTFIPERLREKAKHIFARLISGEEVSEEYFEIPILTKNGNERLIAWHHTFLKDDEGNIIAILSSGEDITEQRKMEEELRRSRDELEIRVRERTVELEMALRELEEKSNLTIASNAILNLFARKTSKKGFLDELIGLIQGWTNCRCVGIRIKDQNQFIPYESYVGFSYEFWKSESFLCLGTDQCTCIRVVRGNLNLHEIPFSTSYGSFYCNNLKEFLSPLSKHDRTKYRGICLENGFSSLAIVPIKYHDQIFGTIHLADERERLVPLKKIEFLEAISPLIGETINRFNLESELNRNYETQRAINFLLRLSLEDISIEDFLKGALNIIISRSWLSSNVKGCIFIVEHEPNTLIMKAQHGMPESIQIGCSKVPFDSCICGKVALTKNIQFTDCQNDRHDFNYEGIKPHSHYHVPILFGNRTLGMITLYLNQDEHPSQEKEVFLNAVANTLAIIILRKEWEEALRESEARLRLLSSQLLNVQENERRQIARDLHDGIGQMLTAIKFKIEEIIYQKDKKEEKLKEESLQTLIPIIRESIEEVRRIQMNLRPSILDDLGLIATVKWFCREFGKIYSELQIVTDFNLEEEEIPLPLKIVIYRIVQEAFNNTAKHAKADLIHLVMKKVDSTIELTIEDNGIGFDLQRVLSIENSPRGLGINSMRERTELSGGKFSIKSTKGKGTTVKATWPI